MHKTRNEGLKEHVREKKGINEYNKERNIGIVGTNKMHMK